MLAKTASNILESVLNHTRFDALDAGRVEKSGKGLEYDWAHRRGAYRSGSYNNLVRLANALDAAMKALEETDDEMARHAEQ